MVLCGYVTVRCGYVTVRVMVHCGYVMVRYFMVFFCSHQFTSYSVPTSVCLVMCFPLCSFPTLSILCCNLHTARERETEIGGGGGLGVCTWLQINGVFQAHLLQALAISATALLYNADTISAGGPLVPYLAQPPAQSLCTLLLLLSLSHSRWLCLISVLFTHPTPSSCATVAVLLAPFSGSFNRRRSR